MPKELLSCRRILDVMLITGFMCNFMLRTNIAIAVVEMIQTNTTQPQNPTLPWTEQMKNDILGWPIFTYGFTQILGGRLAEIYGSKIVFGGSMACGGILTLLTPLTCNSGFTLGLINRMCVGLVLGLAFPVILPMALKWVPPNDRSKFSSHLSACGLGSALTVLPCGYLIATFGWPSVFYVTGTIALLWSVLWWYLIYDSPRQHPRIGETERNYIEGSLKLQGTRRLTKTPWMSILTSGPAWAIIVSFVCFVFANLLVVNELPSYFKYVLGIEIGLNGIYSSVPFFFYYFASLGISSLADRLIKTKKCSVTSVRKIFTGAGHLIPALLFLLLSFWGDISVVALVLFTVCLVFTAFVAGGSLGNALDVAPNYSGTIFGIANMFGAFAGFGATRVVNFFMETEQDFCHWRYVFWITAMLNLFGCGFFVVFGSGKVQNWNYQYCENELNLAIIAKIPHDKLLPDDISMK